MGAWVRRLGAVVTQGREAQPGRLMTFDIKILIAFSAQEVL